MCVTDDEHTLHIILLSDLHCHLRCPHHRRRVMLWLDLHLETYQHELDACPGKTQKKHFQHSVTTVQCQSVTKGRWQTAYLLMLLEQVVQVVTSLVVEIEVLALCLAFGAHHFGNGCPVSPVLN